MDSRERVMTALEYNEPDRVPLDFWATGAEWDLLHRQTGMDREEFLDYAGVDFRYIEGPMYTGPPLAGDTDIWGVTRHKVTVVTQFGEESYSEGEDFPLAGVDSPEAVDAYPRWPDPDNFDYSVVKKQCLKIRDNGKVVVFMGDRLNRVAQLKPAMYLRGIDNILMDLAMRPEVARAVFRRIRDFYEVYLHRILEAADGFIDIVLTGDDFGQQSGLLISPGMWEEFLAEGFRRYMGIIHSFGAVSMHHTCGDVKALADRMNELGLDILQSLQPEALGDALAGLKARLGKKMCFQGGVSVQKILPMGTPEVVDRHVRELISTMAPGGGYIMCTAHNIQTDCPVRNVQAMLEAHKKHGTYPLKC